MSNQRKICTAKNRMKIATYATIELCIIVFEVVGDKSVCATQLIALDLPANKSYFCFYRESDTTLMGIIKCDKQKQV